MTPGQRPPLGNFPPPYPIFEHYLPLLFLPLDLLGDFHLWTSSCIPTITPTPHSRTSIRRTLSFCFSTISPLLTFTFNFFTFKSGPPWGPGPHPVFPQLPQHPTRGLLFLAPPLVFPQFHHYWPLPLTFLHLNLDPLGALDLILFSHKYPWSPMWGLRPLGPIFPTIWAQRVT